MAENTKPRPRSDSEALRPYLLCSNEKCDVKLSREIRLLPCLHPCCERCLQDVARPDRRRRLEQQQGEEEEEERDEEAAGGIRIPKENLFCPKEGCRKQIPDDYLRENNQQTPLNRWLCELVQNLQARDALLRGEGPLCSDCQDQPAVALCRHRDCFDARLCDFCLQYHRRSRRTRDHAADIVTIDLLAERERGEGGGEPQPPHGLRTRPLRCPIHKCKLHYYCNRTRELICKSCMFTYHRPGCSNRECKAVEDFIGEPEHMPLIVGLKEKMNAKLGDLRHAQQELARIRRHLSAHKDDAEGRIRARKAELVAELDEQEAELLRKVEQVYNTKAYKLNVYSERLTRIQQEVEQSAQFVTQFLDNYGPSPMEFFLLKDHIQSALEEILDAYSLHDFHPREDATLEYHPNNRFCQQGAMGDVTGSPDPEHFATDRPIANLEPRAERVSVLWVTCRDAADTCVSDNMPHLKARLVPNDDHLGDQEGREGHHSAVDCIVNCHRRAGKYSVSVFPPREGAHCLWVYEDCPQPTGKKHIRGSPFGVMVQQQQGMLNPFPPWRVFI